MFLPKQEKQEKQEKKVRNTKMIKRTDTSCNERKVSE